MNILVCVKQVPDPERLMVTEGRDGAAVIDPPDGFRMNRFDEFAVEAAVRIKEAFVEVGIDILTVGPDRVLDVVKRSIGMGADRGVHLKTPDTVALDPGAVSEWIAQYARHKDYALILTGTLSEDGMHGQVGPMAAAHLGMPVATQVIRLEPNIRGTRVSIEREIEGGVREVLELRLPAVLALQPGINRPRYPSLSNLLRANRQTVETIETQNLRCGSAEVFFMGSVFPPKTRAGRFLEGTLPEKAVQLLSILKENALIR
jgi:electron transfer flavoprotein beta subunit